jgi:hypothetical protein
MAAASNKPGAVHYALIVFVMITVVLGIVSYMNHREYSDQAAAMAELTKQVSDSKRNLSARVDEVQALKKTIGFMFDLVDDATNPQNANTVKAAALKNMADFGKEFAGKDYAESMQKLREALDAALADRDSKAGQVATLEKDLKAERDKLNARVDTASKAQSKAESDKRDVISVQDERLKAKQDELDKVKQDNNTLVADLAAEKEAHEKTIKKLSNEVAQLENRIELLREKLNDAEKTSFEIADGLIQRVDNSAKLVWINLGSDDFLKPRMTFSVYSKENHGVGRGAEDIKGKIEVTRILGSHIAEARILDEDLFRPMVANDLIYTPLWSPGLVEKIAFVGLMDLDGDGKSDWEELKQLLAISGADVDTYVNENGERLPEGSKITVHTKFLVRGLIPEPTEVPVNDRDRVNEIRKHEIEMVKEARVNGVRTIKLNDFLAFIGFESKRRMFRPGQERPFNLKAGAASATAGEAIGDRSSTGNVSGNFNSATSKKSAPQKTSDGHTSKLFTPAAK